MDKKHVAPLAMPIAFLQIYGVITDRRRDRPYAESMVARHLIFVGPGSVPACSDPIAANPHVGNRTLRSRFVFYQCFDRAKAPPANGVMAT